MTMRWMYPPEFERQRARDGFDPVREGSRHRLSRDVSIAIWERVCAETTATDGSSRRDIEQARRRFHEIATLVAARGGRLLPEVGRYTHVGVELGGVPLSAWDRELLARPAPGHETLVTRAEAKRAVEVSHDRASEAPEEAAISDGAGRGRAGQSPATSRADEVAQLPTSLPQPAGRASPIMLDLSEQRAARRRSRADLAMLWSPPERDRQPRDGRLSTADALVKRGTQVEQIDPQPAAREQPRRAQRFAAMDRAQRVREVARMQRDGELAAALRRGEPGLADALAAALRQGAVVPHPVDMFRANARGLAADARALGKNLGKVAAGLGDRARRWAAGTARAMAFQDRGAAPDANAALEQLAQAGGEPLPLAVRIRMEALFGHRFAHVRVHTDDAAVRAAQVAGARAVTLGSHIYFAQGEFAPGSEAGDRLLLHELTHVVQHDQGRLAQPESGRVELSSPSDPTEREARAMEARVAEVQRPRAPLPTATVRKIRRTPEAAAAARAEAATPEAAAPGRGPTSEPTSEPATGKRASANILGDAASWVGDRIDDVENWAEDKIEGLVAKVAPGLATLIKEGPGGLIKDALEPAIKGWVGTVTGGVNIGQIAGQLKGSFASAFEVLEGAKAGDAKCCDTLVKGIEAIRSVASAFMNNPVVDAIKGIFTKVSDIIGTVTKLVVGPVFDLLKSIVGPAWDAIKGVASTVSGWISKVKSIASKAFDWVAKKLGFSSATGEGGLTDWVENKAVEVWDKIKATFAPVIGPLKVVAGALLLFTGLPQIYAIMKYGPQIVEAVQWMWANRNNPNAAKENPGLLGGTIFPKILSVGQGFVTTVKSGVTWLVQQTTALATGALNLAGAVTGVPLLSMATSFVHTLADGVKSVETWAEGAFTSAEKWLEGLYHTVADFLSKYGKVLTQIAIAVTNPAMIPVILAGEAWQWLPDCIKPPLIDLLLDAVIAILRGMPSLPMLGLLWPLLKSGVIGFLEAVKARDAHTKTEVSNKLAKIISGGSPMFLIGFVKGLLKGVWDGIKMPFEAIWMVAKGIQKAGDFFAALGSEADQKAAAATAPAPATASRTNKAKPPLPGVPSVITPDQASSVVGGIASTLVAQKPKEPPHAPGAPPHAAAKPGQQNEYKQLAGEARRMGGELRGPGQKVATQFWPAVQELFSGGGKSMSLDDLISKLSKVWQAAKSAVASLGAKIANMIVDFLMKPGAEEDIGEAIGYMVGMIAFQALLDYLSAGTWTGAMGVISAIAKFLNWPMEFLGEAMKALKALGGFILDGLKSLGSMVAEASAGALREVMGAFREIGTKLGEFAEELAAKFRGEAEGAGKAAEKDVASAAEKDAGSALEKEAMKAEELGEAIEVSRMITTAEDAGHVPGPAIALSLQALRSRYSWIKTYEAVPNAQGFEIFLIASRFSVGQAHTELGKLPNGLGDHFSKLGDEAAVAFSALPQAELEKLALLSDAQLLNLAKLDEAGLAKIASLDINMVEKLATLEPGALAKLSKLDPAGLGKLASLEEAALTKFAALDQNALGKFATLDEAALQKFAKLDDAVLAKFGSLREANMIEAYGKLSQEHLEKLARLDKSVLEKFAGWAHNPPPRPGFNNILENIAKQDEATIDLIASLKPKPLALSENAAKVVDTVRIRIAGSEYQIDHEVVEHILQRHSREFWEGSVKAEQSFLPAGFGPDEIVDVIRDVLRKNEAEVARIGVGYGPLPLTQSHGITWQLGLNGGHVGQLYPKF